MNDNVVLVLHFGSLPSPEFFAGIGNLDGKGSCEGHLKEKSGRELKLVVYAKGLI